MYGVLDAGAIASVGLQDTGKGQPMKTQSIERLHALDAVRGGALLLGIVVHLSMSFWPIPLWPIRDNDPSGVLLTSFGVIHIFRMSLFFVIAGYHRWRRICPSTTCSPVRSHRRSIWRTSTAPACRSRA